MSNPLSYYQYLRYRRGASPLAALSWLVAYMAAWMLLRLDAPSWQWVMAERRRLYPHISGKRPTAGDPLRIVIQSIWLLVARAPRATPARSLSSRLRSASQRLRSVAQKLPRPPRMKQQHVSGLPGLRSAEARVGRVERWLASLSKPVRYTFNIAIGALAILLGILCITEPFGYTAQITFVLLLWGLALLVRRIPGRFAVLMLIVLSAIISCRYLWWRYTATLHWDSYFDLTCGIVLLVAETYSWVVLILGYVQTCWPLDRKPAPLPQDTSRWPSVDLFIPTYNEDLSVVRTTVLAALGLDWPHDKLHVYICDDGRRDSFRQFAEEVGVGYIVRPDNQHAKAGNLNHALTVTSSELIAIFDCDHIPVRSFLQVTTGWFLRDPKLALVQTPHHFFSPDPFERNLGSFRRKPNEGELFYGLVQNGNDMWNASFFCGSCTVLRREAVESIGGFAVETVTEDAHTALRLHRAGWNSAYLGTPQAAGLATESLSAHIGQRIRWARGMAQIFRTDNPLLGRGLTIFQRLCYANAMLHFLAGLPRLIYLTAPLAFLLLHAYIIYAPALMIVLYVLPHMIHASLTNARMQGEYRHSFWGEVYETVLAWYIARPTTVALFNPSKGTFNVTAKGGLIDHDQFDWRIARPYLVLAALNVAGLGFAVWRLFHRAGQRNRHGSGQLRLGHLQPADHRCRGGGRLRSPPDTSRPPGHGPAAGIAEARQRSRLSLHAAGLRRRRCRSADPAGADGGHGPAGLPDPAARGSLVPVSGALFAADRRAPGHPPRQPRPRPADRSGAVHLCPRRCLAESPSGIRDGSTTAQLHRSAAYRRARLPPPLRTTAKRYEQTPSPVASVSRLATELLPSHSSL